MAQDLSVEPRQPRQKGGWQRWFAWLAHTDESRDGESATLMLVRWWILDCAAIQHPGLAGLAGRGKSRSMGARCAAKPGGVSRLLDAGRSSSLSASLPIILVHPNSIVSLATGQSEDQIREKGEQGQAMQGKLKCDTDIWDVRGDEWVAWKRITSSECFETSWVDDSQSLIPVWSLPLPALGGLGGVVPSLPMSNSIHLAPATAWSSPGCCRLLVPFYSVENFCSQCTCAGRPRSGHVALTTDCSSVVWNLGNLMEPVGLDRGCGGLPSVSHSPVQRHCCRRGVSITHKLPPFCDTYCAPGMADIRAPTRYSAVFLSTSQFMLTIQMLNKPRARMNERLTVRASMVRPLCD